MTTVQQAVRSHNKAKHETEWNQLVSAATCSSRMPTVKIDQATATRFIGYIDDLIAAGG